MRLLRSQESARSTSDSIFLRPYRKINHFIETPLSWRGRSLSHLLFEVGVELGRTVARHAQALPFARLEMLRQVNDLADVISIVRQLAINGLNNRVILAADRYGAHQVFRLQGFDCVKDR